MHSAPPEPALQAAMRKKTYADSTENAVGYGQPPRGNQFKPGQSGNPKGRPKGSRSVGSVLQDILRQKVAVTENGRTRRLSTLDVVLRRLANDAMRNETSAVKLILTLVERYGESPATQVQINELLAEDQAILERFLK
jgi:hypothetical protein